MALVAVGVVVVAVFASFSVWSLLSGRAEPSGRSLPQMHADGLVVGGLIALVICLISGAPWGLTVAMVLLVAATVWRAFRLRR